MTRQRLEVFREVARTEAHPGAETVYERVRERLPRISLDTVYRTLASLERLGAVTKISALHGAARYDANTRQHHHFVCVECGLIRDIHGEGLDVLGMIPGSHEWGEVNSVHAELRGTCAACLASPRTVV